MTVRFTPTAEAKRLGVVAYIMDDNPAAAWSFYDCALETSSRLREYPHPGRAIPEFPALPYQKVIVRPYQFFNRIVGEEVWVMDVWHDARIPDAPTDR